MGDISGKRHDHDQFIVSDDVVCIFTWVMFSVVCQVINVFGVVTNIINIICFVKQDFNDPVNISLLGLAISDLCSLISLVCTIVCLTPAFNTADLPFHPLEINYLMFATPHMTFSRISSWITAVITLERCMCITAPLQIKSLITPRRVSVIIASIYITLIFSVSPVYVVNRLEMSFSQIRNKTIYGIIFSENREEVEQISCAVNYFGIPLTAFVIIVMCTITIACKLQSTTRWRQKSSTNDQVDRVSSRNQKVAKMVVMISVLFITCFIPVCICMLAMTFEPELLFTGKYVNISIMLGGLGFVLESINSSVNICIYYHMSTKYRDTFQKQFCNSSLKNNLRLKI